MLREGSPHYAMHITSILFTEGPEGDPLKRGLGNRATICITNSMKHMSCIIYSLLKAQRVTLSNGDLGTGLPHV